VAWAAGSDAPEKKEVRIGFIPLTDCSSVVMAAVQKFDEKYGIKIIPTKEASWAAVRDKLVNGELDAAHVLYGLVYGVQLGIGGPKKDMNVLMTLNNNGQAITLSNQLKDKGATDGASSPRRSRRRSGNTPSPRPSPPARTPCGSTTGWRARHRSVQGRQEHHRAAAADGGQHARRQHGRLLRRRALEQRAIIDKIGFTAVTTQDIWTDHPEKVLGTTAEWVTAKNPNTARAMTAPSSMPALDRCASLANKRKTAETVAQKSYVNTDMDVIVGRMLGRYENGLGKSWDDKNHMKFFNDGAVNFPYLSDGMWFLTQHKRWGLLKDRPRLPGRREEGQSHRHLQAGGRGCRRRAAEERHAQHKLIDGVVWDGKDPKKYAASFKINA
jgi:nitrate/nitrite transport system substrate-binding protein